MANTKIEWTSKTWNPIRGCTKVSPGCKNCYASTFAERWRGVAGHPYEQGFDLRLVPEKLSEPLRWKKPQRIFVNSMSDLFHEDAPNEYIAAVFGVMAACPEHTFQVLTKRADRMRRWFDWAKRLAVGNGKNDAQRAPVRACGLMAAAKMGGVGRSADAMSADLMTLGFGTSGFPIPNVHLGVSVENQEAANERIPHLLATPAAVRWVSAEPLLADVDIRPWLVDFDVIEAHAGDPSCRAGHCSNCPVPEQRQRPRLDWVVIGGESGPGARPFDLAWARSIVEQCKGAGVPVFVKQLGRKPINSRSLVGAVPIIFNHPKGGDPSEWPADLRVREMP